jgi:pectin lyase
MKRLTTLLLAMFLTIFALPVSTSAAVLFPNTSTNGIMGFAGNAKYDNGQWKESTTGGKGGRIVYINDLQELRSEVKGLTPKILVIEDNIKGDGKQKVQLGANKTIVGSYKNRVLKNIYLETTPESKNIIFQNINFRHSKSINGNNDIQLYITHGYNYWIDHVSFDGHDYDPNGHDLDKLLYVGAKADYITVSNSKFQNHRYGLILGHPDDHSNSYKGYPHMTIANNYFENLYVRGPGLMRYGYFHVKNNYANNFHLAFTIANQATIYSENNYFDAGYQGGGILDDKGNGYFIDIGSYPSYSSKYYRQISPSTNWKPSKYYNYQVDSPIYTKEFVQKYAGSSNQRLVFGH